jgi:hypothetical protein
MGSSDAAATSTVAGMDENTEHTPHTEDPAEGAEGVGVPQSGQGGAIQGDSSHGDSPRGAIQGDADDEPVGDAHGNQGAAQGGAIQGDASHGDSPRGAIQGDAGPDRDAPLGGDETTEQQLHADNAAEEETLKLLDPDNPPA